MKNRSAGAKNYYDLRKLGLYAVLYCTPTMFVQTMQVLLFDSVSKLRKLEQELRAGQKPEDAYDD